MMKQITEQQILEAFEYLDGLSDDTYPKFYEELGEKQPVLMDYVLEFAESLDSEEAREDMVYILGIIWLSFTDNDVKEMPLVTEAIMDKSEGEVIARFQELETIGDEDTQIEYLLKNRKQSQLMEYVQDILGGDEEYPTNFSEDEISLAYTNLMVVIEALEKVA